MAFAYEGFSTVAQNYLAKSVASNFYNKSPLLAVLGALSLGNQNRKELEIGRPNSGEILSGGMVSPIERLRLRSINSYCPRIQAFETSNTAARTGTGRVSLPSVANGSTRSHGQATQAAAKFNWTHYDTPIRIWHEDKIRAGSDGTREGQAISMGQIVDEATEVAKQDLISKLATDIYSGAPSSQSDDLWDAPAGVKSAFSATNTYGGINRTVESQWRAKVVSSYTAINIKGIINDANVTQGLAVKGSGVDLVLCPSALYLQFKDQVENDKTCVVLGDGVRGMAQMGVQKEVLRVNNAYVMYDPSITDSTYVYCFNTATWRFAVHPDFNFKVGKFVDNTTTGEGKEAYDYAYIGLRFFLACNDPTKNAVYTAIA